MCFGCSKEPSHRDSSFGYPQHMFWLENKKEKILLRTLIWRPAMSQWVYLGVSKSFYHDTTVKVLKGVSG